MRRGLSNRRSPGTSGRVALLALVLACPAAAQSPAGGASPALRLTFTDAIARAVKANPSVAQAANDILRAQALLDQASALIKPVVSGAVTTTTLNEAITSNGNVLTPQNQVVAGIPVTVPVLAPVQWAQRAQAATAQQVAQLAAADVRTQVSVATAQAFIAVVARRRVLDAQVLARDTARAHYDYARQRREAGAGSRLNELRAQQQVSGDDALVEAAGRQLYQAEEALGVLVAAEGPATAADDPLLETPRDLAAAIAGLTGHRTDLILAKGREDAAARILADSWKDRLPSVAATFAPQWQQPSTLTQPGFLWRLQFAATVPVFDSGFRSARRAERQVNLNAIRVATGALQRQARSDVRVAQNAVDAAERALRSARDASVQAHEVVDIVNVSFKVGAATNIEVIDAQRVARDTDTSVAAAEYDVRQAHLTLLVALGLFPG
jgi:outer membrane protein